MQTFLANLNYAVRSQQSATLGGGTFSPKELAAVQSTLKQQQETLQTIASMLTTHPEARVPNSKVHFCLNKAKAALADLEHS